MKRGRLLWATLAKETIVSLTQVFLCSGGGYLKCEDTVTFLYFTLYIPEQAWAVRPAYE